jgi:hypothetical protein
MNFENRTMGLLGAIYLIPICILSILDFLTAPRLRLSSADSWP